MTNLIEAYAQGEKQYYEPILTRVTGRSEYNPQTQFRLEGVDGFWDCGQKSLPEPVQNGVLAWFTLATKPKAGRNAAPGSMYKDIVGVVPATDEDKENYSAPQGGSYSAPAPSAASPAKPVASTGINWDERERQIKLGMAFNNLTTMLVSVHEDSKYLPDGTNGWTLWTKWFTEAAAGKPLTAAEFVEAEAVEEPAEEPAPAEEVQSLPW